MPRQGKKSGKHVFKTTLENSSKSGLVLWFWWLLSSSNTPKNHTYLPVGREKNEESSSNICNGFYTLDLKEWNDKDCAKLNTYICKHELWRGLFHLGTPAGILDWWTSLPLISISSSFLPTGTNNVSIHFKIAFLKNAWSSFLLFSCFFLSFLWVVMLESNINKHFLMHIFPDIFFHPLVSVNEWLLIACTLFRSVCNWEELGVLAGAICSRQKNNNYDLVPEMAFE